MVYSNVPWEFRWDCYRQGSNPGLLLKDQPFFIVKEEKIRLSPDLQNPESFYGLNGTISVSIPEGIDSTPIIVPNDSRLYLVLFFSKGYKIERLVSRRGLMGSYYSVGSSKKGGMVIISGAEVGLWCRLISLESGSERNSEYYHVTKDGEGSLGVECISASFLLEERQCGERVRYLPFGFDSECHTIPFEWSAI